MEIYENTALMWLERTQRAELVDLEGEEEKNLEEGQEENLEAANEVGIELVHLGMVGDDKNSAEVESMEVEIEVKKDLNEELVSKGSKRNGPLVLSLEVQCAIGKVRVMINEAKEDLEVAARKGNFAEARHFQEQVR